MDIRQLKQQSEFEWMLPATDRMRVPGVIFASRQLVEAMDEKVREQISNVASLPGIVAASYAMPDAHWGYGFPIGGVVSAGGVGFDISCGVRTLHTGLKLADIEAHKARLADVLFARIPAGVGSTGASYALVKG
ncbi:MAG: RtcB family protein [Gammaproteobacteria bacterium]|nr:RtcB family protein [Gammaproteobacteria bacterium]MBU1731669.1 RtcB family protein [Gammaproteobacteria bacterium]MBU1892493.1 RtcB family protein [Gammaproteobacteria bacterium]